MAPTSATFVVLLAIFVVGDSILFPATGASVPSSAPHSCAGDITKLANNCRRFVMNDGIPKTDPSPECCAVVISVDMPCVCQYVTRDVEKLLSMEKVVYVGRRCGLTIPPGTKCGSYTVPMA